MTPSILYNFILFSFLLSLYQVQIFISQLSSFSFNFQIKSKLLLSFFFFFDKSENPMLSFPGISVWGWRWWKPLKNCGIELRFLRGAKLSSNLVRIISFRTHLVRIWIEKVRNVGEWQNKVRFLIETAKLYMFGHVKFEFELKQFESWMFGQFKFEYRIETVKSYQLGQVSKN